MYLRLNSDELVIKDIFDAFFRIECPVERVRSAQPSGFDAAAWGRLIETGAPGICIDGALGGGGAPLTVGAVIADLLGQSIAPLPLLEHMTATRLIARTNPEHPALPALVTGEKIATIALRPPENNILKLVPAGAVAHTVVALEENKLLITDETGSGDAVANTADLPLANRPLSDSTLLCEGAEAITAFNQARAEWQALMAMALTGIARKSVEIGVEYVKSRYQFGVLIGSFQSLQHGLATAATNVEGAHLLSSRAIAALEESKPDALQLAGMAFLFAAETAVEAAGTSLQYHGGYGFAEEYDIQLYYRRAKGWPLQLGDPSTEYQRLASLHPLMAKGA